MLRHFEEEMRATTKKHALLAIPYVRTKLQLMFAWCMTGLTREEYDSEKNEKTERSESVLDDECERSNDQRRSGSSVCEMEGRPLFHSVHVRTNIGTSVEHLCQDACMSKRKPCSYKHF